MNTLNDPRFEYAIRWREHQIEMAESVLIAGTNIDGTALTPPQIRAQVEKIKFSQHVITAYQFQKIREAEESGE